MPKDIKTRADKARPHMQMLAQLLYILDRPHPEDYVILSTIKMFKHLQTYVKAETVRHLLSMDENKFNKILDRMRHKGWVAVEGEYISVAGQGDKKLDAISGWISYALYNIQERKPLEEWSRLIKK